MLRNCRTVLIFLCVAAFLAVPHECSSIRRFRRSLFDMWRMIVVETGKDPSMFWPYGRYCGMGGIGDPVDNIDGCCQVHDACYGEAEDSECITEHEGEIYIANYKWFISKENTVECGANESRCVQIICNCDRVLASCFRRHLKEYDPSRHHQSIMNYLPTLRE